MTKRISDYETQRNALIPTAEAEADKAAGQRPDDPEGKEYLEWTVKWSTVFHAAMDRLWKHQVLQERLRKLRDKESQLRWQMKAIKAEVVEVKEGLRVA
jgi:hypothetical protein